jgi:hypothetical protein
VASTKASVAYWGLLIFGGEHWHFSRNSKNREGCGTTISKPIKVKYTTRHGQ